MHDVKIVKKAKKGNKKAFQILMESEKSKLYKIAFVYMKNEDEALEVFQETILKAFTSIHSLKEERYFSTWLTRILINTAIELLNKKKRVIPMEKEFIENRTNDHFFAEHHRDLDLLQAITELEEKYKSVLLLRFYKDYSVKEIADILDCPEGTEKQTFTEEFNSYELC
ncbi:sigma-70 family RNA polymerase sigma factor [Bacillus alkalicellulosilyticus]|uniref:sigma-70 family RNA polymerase sigma factor n=1 Tax=Alkalihalobacterium alkalicellulosilyticum TaxID=1912214 RepID=UPI003182DBF3